MRKSRKNLTTAKNCCYRLLEFRPRSEREIRERLRKKDFPEDIISESIEQLKKLNYINDQEFAFSWIKDRIVRPFGLKRIAFQLKQKGIAQEIIEQAINKIKEDYCETEVIEKIAQDKFKKLATKTDPLKTKQRVYSFLLRRGFPPDIVLEVLNNL